MSLTGALRLLAACAELGCAVGLAAECPSSLSSSETTVRLKQLDEAGRRAIEQHRYQEAARDYREASCLAPDSAPIFYSLGVAEAASGDYLAARKSLKTAGRLQPSNVLPLTMLARVNFALADVESLKATLREAASRFPQDGNLHAALAEFLVKNKLFDLALAESLRSQQASGKSAGAVMELAILENTVGAYEDAIRNAASLEHQTGLPDSVKASAAGIAGLSYESTGRREEAIIHLREAIRLDPAQENSYLALAFLFEKAQHYGDAVSVLEEGRRRLPGSTALLLPLGSNLVNAQKYPEGITVLQQLLRRSPAETDGYMRLADAYRQTGESAREVQVLENLAKRNPDYPMIHVLIARALLNRNPADYGRALDELTVAEKTAPADADVFYLRGKAYAATNRYQEAASALEQAIKLNPMDASPYYQLGLIYKKLGRAEQARAILARMQVIKQNGAGRDTRGVN
jgi:tetratricopeptide (TPR) repeat protein